MNVTVKCHLILCSSFSRVHQCDVGNTFRLKRSHSTLSPVSTATGDCLQAGKPSRFEACQLGQLSLLPSVGW